MPDIIGKENIAIRDRDDSESGRVGAPDNDPVELGDDRMRAFGRIPQRRCHVKPSSRTSIRLSSSCVNGGPSS